MVKSNLSKLEFHGKRAMSRCLSLERASHRDSVSVPAVLQLQERGHRWRDSQDVD